MYSREDVYKVIDTERAYQNSLPPNRTDGSTHTVGDYVTMMQNYQADLVRAWTVNAGNDEALKVMRKLAGIAVRCMEEHGAIPRVQP